MAIDSLGQFRRDKIHLSAKPIASAASTAPQGSLDMTQWKPINFSESLPDAPSSGCRESEVVQVLLLVRLVRPSAAIGSRKAENPRPKGGCLAALAQALIGSVPEKKDLSQGRCDQRHQQDENRPLNPTGKIPIPVIRHHVTVRC